VRALATNQLTSSNTWRAVRREISIALLNGITVAAVIGVIVSLIFTNWELGGVIALAMMTNILIAGLAGVLVPLLALGLPTSATAAILLAAFEQYNLQPGPQLFTASGSLVWGLIASLYIGNVMLLVLNLPLAGLWVRLLAIPQPLLYGGILVFSTLGVYSLSNSVFDLVLLFLVGIVGFLMRRYDFPVAPAIIGLILGPMAEAQFRRALTISQGDPSVFVTHPLSLTLLVVAALVLIVPAVAAVVRARAAA